MGLDTKTYWLIDRQSQCDFDFDLTVAVSKWMQRHSNQFSETVLSYEREIVAAESRECLSDSGWETNYGNTWNDLKR
jgi:hypothetical protein